MEKKKKSAGERLEAFFAGKGFYIVLFLCVAVIGVSAWVMLANNKRTTVDYEDEIKANPWMEGNTAPAVTAPPSTAPIAPVIPDTGPVLNAESDDAETGEPVTNGDQEDEADSSAARPEDDMGDTEETAAWTGVEETAAQTFIWPAEGDIEVPFSVSALIYNRTMSDWRTHDGVDIACELGSLVMACSGGKVESIYTDDLYGVTIVIDHGGGLKSVYSNLAEMPTVLAGDNVMPGEIIGSVGITALAEAGEVTHLHFAMTLDGYPVDPSDYLPPR